MPSHEATEQFSDRDSILVECELNSRDGANGSAASTSKQAGDMCVAITPITTAGARVPFSALCDLPQRVKSECKRKKPPSYCLTSAEHMEYITPQKKTEKKTPVPRRNQKNKGQLENKNRLRRRQLRMACLGKNL